MKCQFHSQVFVLSYNQRLKKNITHIYTHETLLLATLIFMIKLLYGLNDLPYLIFLEKENLNPNQVNDPITNIINFRFQIKISTKVKISHKFTEKLHKKHQIKDKTMNSFLCEELEF